MKIADKKIRFLFSKSWEKYVQIRDYAGQAGCYHPTVLLAIF